ncbi:MAG TPA: acyl-CoA dehydrogenase family protein [Acidimicrobiales bacterium]|nr:acyl-CoA dehydrogenase family protein [Acidimicrobiales bacterium]
MERAAGEERGAGMPVAPTEPPAPDAPIASARRLADEVLFPSALDVDCTGRFPAYQLDALAAAGLYGILAPRESGGLGADPPTYARVLEELASGCLTTTFVWAQHHNAVRALAAAPPALRDRFLPDLAAGRVRAGVAFGSLRRPGPPLLVATRDPGGWLLDGTAPFVTGWGHLDVLHVAARTADGAVAWLLADGEDGPTLSSAPLGLAAVSASATVALTFSGHFVKGDRLTLLEPFEQWQRRDRSALRPNGALALGVARRCARLLGSELIAREVERARARLEGADDAGVPRARAEATALATRAAAELVVARGSRAVGLADDAQRLYREAMFLLVFGQTADIRAEQLGVMRALPRGRA